MSRSRRKTPIFGITTASSNKPFKQQENRAKRRASRIASHTGREQPHERVYGNEWASPRDGKQYVRDPRPKDMRK